MLARLKSLFHKWKSKHWDKTFTRDDYEHVLFLSSESPFLRRLWDRHQKVVQRFFYWVIGLIAGAIILKKLGI